MSDTTTQECKCCGVKDDCIDGLCQSCNNYNYQLQKKVDLLTLGLLQRKTQKTLCKNCKYWDCNTNYPVSGACRRKSPVVTVACNDGGTQYDNFWPCTSHDDWCGEGEHKQEQLPKTRATGSTIDHINRDRRSCGGSGVERAEQ